MTIENFIKQGWKYLSKLVTFRNEETWHFHQSIDSEQVHMNLNYKPKTNELEIFVEGDDDWCFPQFNGICKNEEDFETILRLLNINEWTKDNDCT